MKKHPHNVKTSHYFYNLCNLSARTGAGLDSYLARPQCYYSSQDQRLVTPVLYIVECDVNMYNTEPVLDSFLRVYDPHFVNENSRGSKVLDS